MFTIIGLAFLCGSSFGGMIAIVATRKPVTLVKVARIAFEDRKDVWHTWEGN